MAAIPLRRAVARIRRFNRFYTHRVGILDEAHLRSRFNLAQVRVIYELAHRNEPVAADLARDLGLDRGYLSRILRGLQRAGLVSATPGNDARRRVLALTAAGKREFAKLNLLADGEMRAMLTPVSAADRERFVGAVGTIERLLGAPAPAEYRVRAPRPGDLGWVVQRHGELYFAEYRWDERFEALVAGVVARYVEEFDPARDRCWIAEREGERVASIFLVHQDRRVAKLRLLLVEPSARGMGIGERLVRECIAFARKSGYRTITLWTNDVLHAARRIYQRAGFRKVKGERHALFGEGLTGETWELRLGR